MSTKDGVQAEISQTERVTVGGGTQYIGPVIKITTRTDDDGRAVELEVGAEVTALV